MFSIHECVGEDLTGVAVGELEELVQHSGLCVLDGGRRCEEEGDGTCGWWEGFCYCGS